MRQQTKRINMKMRCLEVYLKGEIIDKVFFRAGMTIAEVRKSLIEHDNYDPNIILAEEVE